VKLSATIHVYLLEEGTDVWRPVSAEFIRDDIYRITGKPADDTEHWEFATGDIVRCKQQNFSGGKAGLVAYEKVSLSE
jgi:hypothetical protein